MAKFYSSIYKTLSALKISQRKTYIKNSMLGIKLLTVLLFFIPLASNAQSINWLGNLGWGSTAYDVSQDGSVVVGTSSLVEGYYYVHAFRWTDASGMQDLGTLDNFKTSFARAVSGDGSIVVGAVIDTGGGYGSRAFIWTASTGMQYLIADEYYGSQALDISADGNVVIGYMTLKINNNLITHPFRWTASGGVEDLYPLIGSAGPNGISDDGSVMVGDSSVYFAFRFDGKNLETKTLSGYVAGAKAVSGNGLVTVGELNSSGQISLFTWDSVMTNRGYIGFGGQVEKVSYDGSAVVGTLNLLTYYPPGYYRAFRWTKNSGIENLNTTYASILSTGTILNFANSITGDNRYIVGGAVNGATGIAEAYILDTQIPLKITQPTNTDKFIAGEHTTIKWSNATSGHNLKIEYSVNDGNSYSLITTVPADAGQYDWKIPLNTLSTKVRIRLTDMNYSSNSVESQKFRIKPYVLTRIDADSNYYEFRKNRDQWGFSNTEEDMWPQTWWQQFIYSEKDPFTNKQYSQTQCNGIFKYTPRFVFPDWISWVNSFGVSECYANQQTGIYWPSAILRWWTCITIDSLTWHNWKGSCFGIAAASALEFSWKDEFHSIFQNFPQLTPPIVITSEDGVKRVVNELFTHQYGNPTKIKRGTYDPTPKQTIDDIKNMLWLDNADVMTLSLWNNGPGGGGHTVLAYGLEQDTINSNIYYIKIYDNSNPNSNNPITIDIAANNGNGTWNTPDWPGWGGTKWLLLEVPTSSYLQNASLSKISKSPFALDNSTLEVFNPSSNSIKIIDASNNETGFSNSIILNHIPGSRPLIVTNGSEGPPYAYSLPKDNYSIILNDFTEDTVKALFSTGNKSFMYERYGTYNEQFDNLYFDGGLEVSNNNSETKATTLLNLISEGTQEKLFIASSIDLNVYSSVKIENPDSNTIKITSTFLDDNYDIELNYVTAEKLDRFIAKDIWLPANASETFIPEWTDLLSYDLKVLIDFDNDGIADDSLYLQNQFTDVKDHGSLLSPTEFNLAQNYPNPFNPATTIQYSIPKASNVEVKVYDVLGNEVATLVDEYKESGRYEVNFDASKLSSGIYFYKLQAGSFVETKKMILLK